MTTIVRHEARRVRCSAGDAGRPLGGGLQGQVPNRLTLRWSRARVVSVKEKAPSDCVRYGSRR